MTVRSFLLLGECRNRDIGAILRDVCALVSRVVSWLSIYSMVDLVHVIKSHGIKYGHLLIPCMLLQGVPRSESPPLARADEMICK